MRFTAATCVATLLLAGCASGPEVQGRLHLGMDDAPEGTRLTWPAPPEVPRFLYVGTLTGEANFRREAPADALSRLGRWVAGLDGRNPDPVVLQRPSVVTGDDAGRLYVSDTSRRAVFVFDATAGTLQRWPDAAPGLGFVAPSGLAVAEGRLWVADAELGAVFELDAQGRPQRTLGQGRLQRPTGLARDPASGRLYVADTTAHDVKVFEADGRLAAVIGRRGREPGEFNFPTHLAWADGALYVTDTLNHRIQVLAPDGTPRRRFGRLGLQLGDLVRPKGVSVDGDGNVYVVESYYDSLLVFNAAGEFLMPIGGTGTATGRFYLPAGVWVDAGNRVHVADMFNGRIVLFQFLGGG